MRCFAIKRYYMPNLPWDLGPRDRGFESRSPDQKADTPYGGIRFLLCGKGFEPFSMQMPGGHLPADGSTAAAP